MIDSNASACPCFHPVIQLLLLSYDPTASPFCLAPLFQGCMEPLFTGLCNILVLSPNISKAAYIHFFVSTEKQAFLEHIS